MTELKKPSTFFARVSTSHLTEDQVAQYTSNPETVFDIIHCLHPESLTTATVLFDEASFGDELLAEVRLTDEFLDVVKVTDCGLFATGTIARASTLVLTLTGERTIHIVSKAPVPQLETWIAYPKEVLVGLHHITRPRDHISQQYEPKLIDQSGTVLGEFEEFILVPGLTSKINEINTFSLAVFRVSRDVLYEKFSDFVEIPQPVGNSDLPFFMPKTLKFYALVLETQVTAQTTTQTIVEKTDSKFYELMPTDDGSEVPPLEYADLNRHMRLVQQPTRLNIL